MSGPMKAIPHPPGTLWSGKVEVNGVETYVESYVKGDKLYFHIGKKAIFYDKTLLLRHNLMEIGESAVKEYESLTNPKPEEEQKVHENAESIEQD